jgi:NADH-quinone oxidoreductase subunit G
VQQYGLALIPGKPLDDALSLAAIEEIETLVILENDLYRRAPKKSVDQLFDRSRRIMVLDHLLNQTTLNADILLPAATFAESEGTLVNNEGRAQRFYKVLVNKDHVKESWRWMSELIRIKNENKSVLWNKFDEIATSLVNEIPAFSR